MRAAVHAALAACLMAGSGVASSTPVLGVNTMIQVHGAASGNRRLLDADTHTHEDGEEHDHDYGANTDVDSGAGAVAQLAGAGGPGGGTEDPQVVDPAAGGGPGGGALPGVIPAEAPVEVATVAPTAVAATSEAAAPEATTTDTTTAVLGTLAESPYYGSYSIENDDYGTMLEVVVTETTREIMTNVLPDWSTDFPTPGSAWELVEQNLTFSIPLEPISPFRNSAEPVREFGISVVGITYEPGNAQSATCDDGSELRIEAFNNPDVDFGVDVHGAHTRDQTGQYHYHALPNSEIALADESQDIVHIGFTFDSHMLYYSRSGLYKSSYVLSTEPRNVTCTYSEPDIPEFTLSQIPDGTVSQDWVYTAGAGDLDECNGITVDGEYAYFATDEYPYIPRCHMGESTAGESATGGGGGGGGGPGDAEAPGAAEGPDSASGPTADGDTEVPRDIDLAGTPAEAAASDVDAADAPSTDVASGTVSQNMFQAVGVLAGAAVLSVLM